MSLCSIPVPKALSDITVDWLASVLVQNIKGAKEAKVSEVNKKGTENGLFSATVTATGKVSLTNGEESNHRVFVKMMPPRDDFQSFISDSDLDINEIKTYKILFADLMAFERKHLGDRAKLEQYVPHGYAGDYTREAEGKKGAYYVMLEDLSPEFANADISKGLTVGQTKAALVALAHYSAVAYCYGREEGITWSDKYPFLCKFFDKTMIESKDMFDYIGTGLDTVAGEYLDGSPLEELRPQAKILAKTGQKTLRELCIKDRDKFLHHGDSWSNNFLFNSKGDVKLIDWQFTGCGNLMLDFGLAAYVGLKPEDIEANWDGLISSYYDSFKEVCVSMGMEKQMPWTREQFSKLAKTEALLITLLWWGASYELAQKFDGLKERIWWALKKSVEAMPDKFE